MDEMAWDWLTFSYAVNSAVWSVGGALIGAVVGYWLRGQKCQENAMRDDQPVTSDDDREVHSEIVVSESRGWFRIPRWLGILIVILTLGTMVQAVYFSTENRQVSEENKRITACQAEFNRQFALALTERTNIANSDREVLNTFIDSVAKAKSGADVRAALTNFQRVTAENEAKRAANPLPAIPSRTCGG